MIRIAIADDHQQVRETWNFILSTNPGFQVIAKCANGQEAIDTAASVSPDVFIMDINMEGVNGIEATQAITQNHPHIRVVGVSIHAEPAYVRKMIDAGARAYVTKNSSYKEVFAAILAVYEGHKFLCEEIKGLMPETAAMFLGS